MYRSTGTEKFSFTGVRGRRHTILQFYRDGEKREKNHVIKNPILLRIPYTKNLTVRFLYILDLRFRFDVNSLTWGHVYCCFVFIFLGTRVFVKFFKKFGVRLKDGLVCNTSLFGL